MMGLTLSRRYALVLTRIGCVKKSILVVNRLSDRTTAFYTQTRALEQVVLDHKVNAPRYLSEMVDRLQQCIGITVSSIKYRQTGFKRSLTFCENHLLAPLAYICKFYIVYLDLNSMTIWCEVEKDE